MAKEGCSVWKEGGRDGKYGYSEDLPVSALNQDCDGISDSMNGNGSGNCTDKCAFLR